MKDELIEKLTRTEEEYEKAKLILDKAKAIKILNTNWKEVNNERSEYGLEIIKNKEQRDAYYTEIFFEEDMKILEKKIKYNKNKYEYELKTKGE